MKTAETTPKRVPISEFKTHCTEYLREIENGAPPIRITRHGKVIGILNPDSDDHIPPLLGAGMATGKLNPSYDPQTSSPPKTLADLMGIMPKGSLGLSASDFDEPTFSPKDWEEHPANEILP